MNVSCVPCWHLYQTFQITFTYHCFLTLFSCSFDFLRAAKTVSAVWDCISTLISLTPLDGFKETLGVFPDEWVVTMGDFWQGPSKPKQDLFLTLTNRFLCLNLTRPYAQRCYKLKYKKHVIQLLSCNINKCFTTSILCRNVHCQRLFWQLGTLHAAYMYMYLMS